MWERGSVRKIMPEAFPKITGMGLTMRFAP
jgi:hypothetical protein